MSRPSALRTCIGPTVLALVAAAALPALPAAAAAERTGPERGAKSTWTEADKAGFGTARTRRSNVWFTLQDGRVADPVANFHLSNGALVDALRWRANTEDYGLERSWGVMASYRYDPTRIPANAAAYAAGESVPMSDEVRALLAG